MLVLPLAWFDTMPTPQVRVPLLVGGLAFIMGLQNAIVTHISEARVRTTHVSGMATDLGMEVAIALDRLRNDACGHDDLRNRHKIILHGSTMFAFLAGGILGVVVYRQVGAMLFLVVTLLLLMISAEGLRRLLRG
ncbi:YoaK family protein [Rhizobium sp. LjRoot30]